jgi:hypothetical protein
MNVFIVIRHKDKRLSMHQAHHHHANHFLSGSQKKGAKNNTAPSLILETHSTTPGQSSTIQKSSKPQQHQPAP